MRQRGQVGLLEKHISEHVCLAAVHGGGACDCMQDSKTLAMQGWSSTDILRGGREARWFARAGRALMIMMHSSQSHSLARKSMQAGERGREAQRERSGSGSGHYSGCCVCG